MACLGDHGDHQTQGEETFVHKDGSFYPVGFTASPMKNEAGKTATLCALQSILPYGAPQTKFDVTTDYPRRFATRYKKRHPNGDAVAVETWWQLSDEAYEILSEAFGDDAMTSPRAMRTGNRAAHRLP